MIDFTDKTNVYQSDSYIHAFRLNDRLNYDTKSFSHLYYVIHLDMLSIVTIYYIYYNYLLINTNNLYFKTRLFGKQFLLSSIIFYN